MLVEIRGKECIMDEEKWNLHLFKAPVISYSPGCIKLKVQSRLFTSVWSLHSNSGSGSIWMAQPKQK